MTAKWEKELESISKAKAEKSKFIAEIKQYTLSLVENVKQNQQEYRHDNLTKTKCPVCGKPMLAVNGKKGKMLVCQDRSCNERINISRHTNVRCPVCHKHMELFGDAEKKLYVCSCGFKEKADIFHKKMAEQRGASKNTVQNYMKKQKQAEREEKNQLSAFGKALLEALKEE